MKTLKIGVVMDHISSIKPYKDTSLAIMLGAQKRGWELYHIVQEDMFLQQGVSFARAQRVKVYDSNEKWYELSNYEVLQLSSLDIIFMRKDPPVDANFLTATWILSIAQREGVLVVNHPDALRNCNEKLFAQEFSDITAPTIVSTNIDIIKDFWQTHGDIILKPLDGMGGTGIFRVKQDGLNLAAICESLTGIHGDKQIMAQKFLPEIKQGDTRILLIDGEPIEYGLARIPKDGETRGNLAAGGTGVGRKLTDRDYYIVERVKTRIKQQKLYFVGLDVIGDYLTEINVTSPTCVRELENLYHIDIVGKLLDSLATKTLVNMENK